MRYVAVMIGVLVGAVSTAFAADSFPINVYPCPRAESAPALDGKLDDAVWQRASLVSGFTLLNTDKLVSPQTSFRLLWDDKYLYLGVQCDEPQMDKISPMRYAHDEPAVFGRHSIEFFVDPDHTHDLYYQLAFNVAGSLYDGERFVASWNSGAEVKTHLGEKFWSAEVAVPWGPLKAKPNPGKVVGFNVSRNHNIEGQTYATWAQLQNGFHDPERFAHLVLSGTPQMIGRLSGEFRKGGRTGPIVVYSAEDSAQNIHTKLAEVAFAEVQKLLADLATQRRKEKEPELIEDITRRLDEYRAKLAGLKAQCKGELDTATRMRVDLELQTLIAQLRKTVAEVSLAALLKEI